MNYHAFTGLFNGLVALAVGFFILSKNPKNLLFSSFSIFAGFVGFWAIFYACWRIQTTKENALFFVRLALMFSYFIPTAFLWFALNLIEIKKRNWFRWLLIPPFIFALCGFSKLMISDVASKLTFAFWPEPGLFMHFHILSFFLYTAVAYGIFLNARKKVNKQQRRQIKWVAFIMLPGWVGGSTTWFLWYDIPIPPIPDFFVGISFLLLGYVVIRNNLFDLEALAGFIQEAKLSALGIMATSINHEVKNPLFVIKGLAEILLDKEETSREKIKEIAQRTIAQTERALGIIKNFSEYAKRQSIKTFEARQVDLKKLVEDIIPLVRSELALDNIKLYLKIPPGTFVYADHHSLEEVFLNLIVNACQAMPEGGEIEISAQEEKAWIRISIRDDGPGLAQEQISRIFEPFYTTKASGTGLGLYVVKQLVEKNNGKVEVLSKEGFGTTFILLFPI